MTLGREQMIDDIERASSQLFDVLLRPVPNEWIELTLSLAQLKALYLVDSRGPMTVGTLGQTMQVQLPAASHVADSLVRLGFARRLKNANDRRCTYIQLTQRGEELVHRLRDVSTDAYRGVLAALSDEDLAAAHRGLLAMAAVAARESATGSDTLAAEPADGSASGKRSGACLGAADIRDLEEEIS
jgi:DNA-binding MarR family transcriptional regulator